MANGGRTYSVVITGDSKGAQRALKDLGKAADDTQGDVTGAASRMGAALDKLQASGAGVGTALKDAFALNVGGAGATGNLAGAAGLAGGLAAAAAGAAAFGAAAVKAFTDSARQAEELHQVTGQSIEDSSRLANAARSLGVDYADVLDSTRQLATGLTTNGEKLRAWGITIQRTADGAVDYAATLRVIAQSYNAQTDPAQRAALGAAAFGEEYNKIIPLLLRFSEVSGKLGEQGGILHPEDIERAKQLAVESAKVRAHWEALKISIGLGVVPALSDAFEAVDKMMTRLEKASGGKAGAIFAAVLSNVIDLGAFGPRAIDKITEILVTGKDDAEHFADAIHSIRAATKDSEAAWAAWEDTAINATTHATTAAESAHQAITSSASAFARFAATQTIGVETSAKYAEALAALGQVSDAYTAGQQQAADQLEAAAQRVAAAEKAQLAAATDVAQALTELDKTRAAAAAETADAEIDAARRVQDAAEALAEAQVRGAKDVRAAEQDLADSRADAADQIAAAVNEDNPFKRQRIIEAANRKIADAEAKLAETRTGAADDVAEAQARQTEAARDAAKARAQAAQQAAERIAQAEQRVQEAQQRTIESADQLSDAVRDAGRAQESAAQASGRLATAVLGARGQFGAAVQSTHDYAVSLAAAGASQAEINAAIETTRQRLIDTANTNGFPTDKLQVFLDLLDQIPRQIPIELGLTLNAYQFRQQLIEASRSIQDPVARANVASGAALGDVGLGIASIPAMATGGMFVTPGARGGAGLAILHDGEVVTPAAEVGRDGGVTVHVTVQGSVISAARDLADVIAEATRRGVALAGRP